MRNLSTGFCRATVVACLVFAGLAIDGVPRAANAGDIIYFADVVGPLRLDAQQRPKVQSIVKQSEIAILAVFTKYGINPRATPDPNKLRPARGELEAIERSERKQLKKILDDRQLKKYDVIMKRVRARVARAALGNAG